MDCCVEMNESTISNSKYIYTYLWVSLNWLIIEKCYWCIDVILNVKLICIWFVRIIFFPGVNKLKKIQNCFMTILNCCVCKTIR